VAILLKVKHSKKKIFPGYKEIFEVNQACEKRVERQHVIRRQNGTGLLYRRKKTRIESQIRQVKILLNYSKGLAALVRSLVGFSARLLRGQTDIFL